jgi:hypothetical protein
MPVVESWFLGKFRIILCVALLTSKAGFSRYPIYRIPTGPTLRDLAACFLTFHSLSTSMHGASGVWDELFFTYGSMGK